nr:sugar transferase [Williamsia sp. CHRR-6]
MESRVSSPQSWVSRYIRSVWATDVVVIVAAVLGAQFLRYGPVSFDERLGRSHVPVWVVSLLLIAAWVAALRIRQCTDRRIIASGPTEYARIVAACFGVFGTLAIADLLFDLGIARIYIAIALPVGTVGLIASHWLWRGHLNRRRGRRLDLDRVVVVGEVLSALPLIDRLHSMPGLGYEVIGVCVPADHPDPLSPLTVGDRVVEILGHFGEVREVVSRAGAGVVAVASAEALGHSAMRELSWELEGLDVDMLVAPGVVDVAGPRMHMRPVAGLPLLHIDKPTYNGANKFVKAAVDRVGALALLIAVSPLLLVCAVAIKLDSRGPVFYKSERVGVNNIAFAMWKFRSMVTGADAMRADLAEVNEGAGALFKIRDDPRVTRVGRIIRRYSIDELPQLFNVIGGSMSLVGPRPPLPCEVETYDGPIVRRMLVRPGMTGLWQVSGRSDLSWEESVRLDLTYVENWSIMSDAMILWRTARAVLGRHGAY